jgi:hypothetical protein
MTQTDFLIELLNKGLTDDEIYGELAKRYPEKVKDNKSWPKDRIRLYERRYGKRGIEDSRVNSSVDLTSKS